MIGVMRIVGWILVVVGSLICAAWFIEPLRQLWPAFLALPAPVRWGLIIAAVGLVVVMATLIHERWQAREADENLKNDEGAY